MPGSKKKHVSQKILNRWDKKRSLWDSKNYFTARAAVVG